MACATAISSSSTTTVRSKWLPITPQLYDRARAECSSPDHATPMSTFFVSYHWFESNRLIEQGSFGIVRTKMNPLEHPVSVAHQARNDRSSDTVAPVSGRHIQ